MKTIASLIIFLTTLSPLFAQQLDGTYKVNSDSITFSGNHVHFSLSGFAGLSTILVGEGTFSIEDNLLIVNTTDFTGARTIVETLPGTLTDSVVVRVMDYANFLAPGIFVEAIGATGRGSRNANNRIQGVISDNRGIAYLTKNENIRRIHISGMGIHNISFDYDSTNDYHVTIARNEVVENTTVVFRWNRIDDEVISLLLLTTDFNEGRNRTKALESLDRRAQRNNRLEKRLRKVHEPFVRSRF